MNHGVGMALLVYISSIPSLSLLITLIHTYTHKCMQCQSSTTASLGAQTREDRALILSCPACRARASNSRLRRIDWWNGGHAHAAWLGHRRRPVRLRALKRRQGTPSSRSALALVPHNKRVVDVPTYLWWTTGEAWIAVAVCVWEPAQEATAMR